MSKNFVTDAIHPLGIPTVRGTQFRVSEPLFYLENTVKNASETGYVAANLRTGADYTVVGPAAKTLDAPDLLPHRYSLEMLNTAAPLSTVTFPSAAAVLALMRRIMGPDLENGLTWTIAFVNRTTSAGNITFAAGVGMTEILPSFGSMAAVIPGQGCKVQFTITDLANNLIGLRIFF
jgi:hypothetical protein